MRTAVSSRSALALVAGAMSILVVVLALVAMEEPLGFGFDSSESIRYYRIHSFMLAFGFALGGIALTLSTLTPSHTRYLGLLLGGAGFVAGGGALFILVGLCGPQVFFTGCSP